MKKVSTEELVTRELDSYLSGVLSCYRFDDGTLDRFVTGKALESIKRLPTHMRAYAIGYALGTVDYQCINGFPYPQAEDEFFLAPTEFEIDVTQLKLEEPEDFYIRKTGDCKLAYYSLNYGAFIALDLNRLEKYVNDYLADAAG